MSNFIHNDQGGNDFSTVGGKPKKHKSGRNQHRQNRRRSPLESLIPFMIAAVMVCVLSVPIVWAMKGKKNEESSPQIAKSTTTAINTDSTVEDEAIGGTPQDTEQMTAEEGIVTQETAQAADPQTATDIQETETADTAAQIEKIKARAEYYAIHYDYAKAIKKISQGLALDSTDSEMIQMKNGYVKAKKSLVEWTGSTEHVFFHQLIVDPSITFGADNESDWLNFNSVMTTLSEFQKMMQSMYEKGYVLVKFTDLYDVNVAADGSKTIVKKKLMLPEGKMPLIISEDDTNFYEATTIRVGGMGQKFVLDDNGDVKVEYKDKEGNTLVGDYDLVPALDTFLDEHPDFSYKGAKGYIGVTGYNGVLGYRINEIHTDSQTQSSNMEADREMVKKIAKACRKDGWEFASHSYAHGRMSEQSIAEVIDDAENWKNEVGAYVGDTDVYLFPYGDWGQNGTETDAKLQVLTDYGFTSLNGVGLETYNAYKDQYFFSDRCNLDGQTLYNHGDYIAKFFDSSAVWDPGRPADSSGLSK